MSVKKYKAVKRWYDSEGRTVAVVLNTFNVRVCIASSLNMAKRIARALNKAEEL